MPIEGSQDLTLTFCCAMGQFRGPENHKKFSGSKYVDIGYTGLHDWLLAIPIEERLRQLKIFHAGDFLVFIVDEPDKNIRLYAEALKFVLALFDQAKIPYLILDSYQLERISQVSD